MSTGYFLGAIQLCILIASLTARWYAERGKSRQSICNDEVSWSHRLE